MIATLNYRMLAIRYPPKQNWRSTSAITVDGVGSIDNIVVTEAGLAHTLQTTNVNGLANATTAGFDVAALTADHIVFDVNPTTTGAGESIAPAVEVGFVDIYNNFTSIGAVNVTLSLAFDPSAGVATFSGGASTAPTGGVATFPAVSIDTVGTGYTLYAIAAGFNVIESNAFNITP